MTTPQKSVGLIEISVYILREFYLVIDNIMNWLFFIWKMFYIEMIDCGESECMIEIYGRLDKSNT